MVRVLPVVFIPLLRLLLIIWFLIVVPNVWGVVRGRWLLAIWVWFLTIRVWFLTIRVWLLAMGLGFLIIWIWLFVAAVRPAMTWVTITLQHNLN